MANFDISQYMNVGHALSGTDILGGFRKWQQYYQKERENAEQTRQFNVNEQQQDSQFSQEQDYKNRVSNDINSRFGLELGEKTNARGYERESSRYKQQQSLLLKARQSAAEGRWNEVESMLGSLKELGADVSRETDGEGKPIYHLQGGQAPNASGETFDSAMSRINQNRSANPGQYQFDPTQPTITQPAQVNQFDNYLGTTSQTVRPETRPNVSQDTQQQLPTTYPQSTQPPTSSASGRSFDPYEINSAQLQKMNEVRMRPMLAGIEGAFPNRFQPQIQSLLGGISAMGGSPEGTLDALQKPMDTAARLMGAELNSEGQMSRAGMMAGNQANSENRQRENEAYKRAEQASKDYGVRAAVDNSVEMQQIHQQLMSDNPNANADGIKALLSMREGNRLTDKDFDIGVTGYASNWDQARTALTRVYQTGLTPDQKSNFNQLIRMFQEGNKRRINSGSQKLLKYMNSFRNEAERYGVYNYIRGRIPDEYLPKELLDWDPSRDFGGRNPSTTNTHKSATVTAPTPQQAVQGIKSLDEEADEFLTP